MGQVCQRIVAAALMCLTSVAARAAVSPEQAARLHTTLTPVGAEKAASPDGLIPAWTGGDPRPDQFEHDAKLFTITAATYQRYADRLPDGAIALFRTFPDFTMDIYPTHRTARFPQDVYDSIYRNAGHAHAAPEGIAYGVAGASGGVPFPIPANGTEIVWNHLLAFWGVAREVRVSTYVVVGGSVERSAAYHEVTDFPYYYPNVVPGDVGSYYFKTRRIEDWPPARADEAYIAWQPLDTARDRYVAWRVLRGEHRVRKAPSLSYDTPDADASGLEAEDEYYLFFGGPDHYDFKIIGKREIYVPYNNNLLYAHGARAAIGRQHEVPGTIRYELHRVWVVEGTLAAGKHDVVSRRRLYIDEDSWLCEYSEEWDEDGRLWKFGHGTMDVLPEVPTIILGTQFVYDLLLGGYAADFVFGGADAPYHVTPPHDPQTFSAQALAAQSDR